MINSWPGGQRHPMSQSEHEAWNSVNYPGTRQLCQVCDAPTGRCEDDSLFCDADEEVGPMCVEHWEEHKKTCKTCGEGTE